MATPPTPTVRTVPTGYKMPDGYRTVITLAKNPSIEFWEKQVTPIGFDGGEKIDTTTMHNNQVRTADHRHLVTITDGQATVAYDPDSLPEIYGAINEPDVITERYPNGGTYCYYGFLKSFQRSALVEGQFPEATAMFAVTNQDTSGNEAPPVYTPAAGT